MSASRSVTSWGGKVHEDILIAMSGVIQPGRSDWDKIMHTLREMGYTFTESALKQHLQKLKRKENGGSSAPGSAPSTPSKKPPKVATPKDKTKGSAGKKRRARALHEDDDEEALALEDLKVDIKKPKLDSFSQGSDRGQKIKEEYGEI
ncbi:hypothetical protein GGS21DRAFT_307147 [Xylaria nigripes]|nr:hypothetical protein GGS21DRAFT_307147 [Xylaria nigripes]